MRARAKRIPGQGLAASVTVFVTLLSACHNPVKVHHRQAFVMGTLVEISASEVRAETFQEAAGAAFRKMRALHNALHPLRRNSCLVRFNAQAHAKWVPLTHPLKRLVPRALSVQRASNNAFNPHLGRLVALWGLREPPFPDHPPTDEAIKALLAAGAGAKALILRRRRVLEGHLKQPGAALALGGIAKGFAVDRAVAALRAHGIDNALINAGGDMRALGHRGRRPWRIGIRHPREEQQIIAIVELRAGEAIVTSGDYERFFRVNGKRYHHILDPETGRPARAAQQATVLGSRATEADAWSTALFVEGPKGLNSLGPDQPGLVIDAQGQPHANPIMSRRLHWHSQELPRP